MICNPIGTAHSGTTVFTSNTKIKILELTEFVNLKTVGRYFVNGCNNLEEVYLPSSLTTIGDYAFVGTQKVKKFYCYAQTAPALGNRVFANTQPTSMGYNTRTQNNAFHVPVNATGYDAGEYSTALISRANCGFTIYYDL